MIQRIQSIYLLLAAILTAITMGMPLVTFTDATGKAVMRLTAIGYDTTLPELAGHHPFGSIIILLLAVILPFVAIFSFKNRRKQIRWTNYACIANALLLLVVAYQTYDLASAQSFSARPDVCILLPVLAIVATLMARRGIRRDEARVRAADRIR